jgi:hypothetical protein
VFGVTVVNTSFGFSRCQNCASSTAQFLCLLRFLKMFFDFALKTPSETTEEMTGELCILTQTIIICLKCILSQVRVDCGHVLPFFSFLGFFFFTFLSKHPVE